MNGGFGSRGHSIPEGSLSYSMPNGSSQAQYAHGSSSGRAPGAQETAIPPSLGGGFVGGEGPDHAGAPPRAAPRGMSANQSAGHGNYGQSVYARQVAPSDMGNLRVGTGHSQQAGLQYGDIQQAGNPGASIGSVQEHSAHPYNMEMGYRGNAYAGNQSIQSGGVSSSANPQYMDIHDNPSSNPYMGPRPHPRAQSQPRPLPPHQSQIRGQPIHGKQYMHSKQQYMPAFSASQPQSPTMSPNQMPSQVRPQTHYLSHTQPPALHGPQPQYYSHSHSHSQPSGVQQPLSHPIAHPLPHPYSQGSPRIQASAQMPPGDHSQPQRYSSSSSSSSLRQSQAPGLQPSFQSYSSSSIGQMHAGPGPGPSPLYGDDTGGPATGKYRSKPYSQQTGKHGTQQPLHSNPIQPYSQGAVGCVSGASETELRSMSQSISNIGFKTSNIDLGICSFQVNVPNNISDELRNSIIRLVPKEQLNSVFFLVSSLICKSIQFRDFHARLIAILRSSQLVEILENMLRDYFQQNSSSQLMGGSQIPPDSRSQVSHPIISQSSAGRPDYVAAPQGQYSGAVSGCQAYDGALMSSMISHSHSKKSISRHGGHYNMHAKEDILLQMLRHARLRSAVSMIGVDITGPSYHLSKLISGQTAQSKCMIQEEESISKEILGVWTEKLNNFGRYLLSCDSSLNLKFESPDKPGVSRMGKIVQLESQPSPDKPIFSQQAVKTIHRLASFYIRDILKFLLDEEGVNSRRPKDQDLDEEGGDDTEERHKPAGRDYDLPSAKAVTPSRVRMRQLQMGHLRETGRLHKDPGPGSSSFGMGKSIGGKGLGMKLNSSGNVSPVKPVMITSLWSCIYRSLRYSMNKYNACEPNAFHNIIIKNRPGSSRDQCSNYILIPESMYRCVESWLLSNAYNQWDKLSVL
ncbi:hypothetical protein OJ252_3028 [Cryptosporidium canis]|uniref:Uncharacterized protein n=1 Tax=Cryptosporidium canis TaxID=195482 RepID=A0ABQ8P3I5_9CRYT|nr:hypothetical protein OJ252_3028 [Cryptosporidium canis]